uniref:F-box domain-containing protein n=1 Tax=Anopheles funestus TaxID=62324 RepID=A0A182RIQ9_ANOFN
MELLALDEDSLMEIFSYFCFNELLVLSSVCKGFLHLCQRHLRKIRHFELDYRSVAGRENYPEYLRNVFTSLGPTLEAFRFSGGYIMDETLKQLIVDGVAAHCTNLRHLTINYTILNEQQLRSLAVLLETLVHLDLGRCDLTDDSLGELLRSRPLKLQTLAIPGNTNLLGVFFKDWTTAYDLEQLDLSYCFSLNVQEMDEFLKHHATRLRAVDVTGSLWLQRNKDIFRKDGRSISMGTSLPVLEYYKAG